MIKLAAIRTNNGEIYTDIAHHLIFAQKPKGFFKNNSEQGFITDDEIFVDRVEALKIAVENNQIITKHGNQNELYSEDLRY